MKRLPRDLIRMLILAALWAASGYALGGALEAMGIPYPPIKVVFASINVILGLTLFLGITRDPTAERIFFEGPGEDDDIGGGYPQVGCLWFMPASLLIFGLLMWLWAIVLQFILPK